MDFQFLLQKFLGMAPGYSMLAGSSAGLMPTYPAMLPGQDLSHMGLPGGFDLTAAYNPQLVSQSFSLLICYRLINEISIASLFI